jgi:hypothetical protein
MTTYIDDKSHSTADLRILTDDEIDTVNGASFLNWLAGVVSLISIGIAAFYTWRGLSAWYER